MTVTDKQPYPTQYLPEAVAQVKKEIVKSFSHSKRVGGYLLGRTLGVGSFAKVKESLHLTTGEKVAIKVIDKKRTKTDNYVRKNLRREGRLLQMVRHPNIVSLLEVMETDNSYYLVMEICKGGDLMEYITARKRLHEQEVVKYIGQIVSAVDYLHRLGIIHRDLKIENLLLDGNKDIKLIDFGLSNSIKVSTTTDGARSQEFCVTQCGSPAYAAPELLNHEKYGLQVDLWSIGVNMYAMLTGGLPFTVEPFNIKALYAKMRDRLMNPIPDDLSRDCRDLLRKFLNPDPARRVTIAEALNHSWLTSPGNNLIPRVPCPNKIRTADLDPDILSHMSENLGFRMGEVIKFVTCNTPGPACSTYHLFLEKLQRYNADMRASGQVPATVVRRPSGDEGGQGKITLHLKDIRASKPLPKPHQPRLSSTTGNGTPSSRIPPVSDITTTTSNNGRKDREIKAGRDASQDRKENLKPKRGLETVHFRHAESPTLSDSGTTSSEVKGQNQRQQQELWNEPHLTKGNTAVGVLSPYHTHNNTTSNNNKISNNNNNNINRTTTDSGGGRDDKHKRATEKQTATATTTLTEYNVNANTNKNTNTNNTSNNHTVIRITQGYDQDNNNNNNNNNNSNGHSHNFPKTQMSKVPDSLRSGPRNNSANAVIAKLGSRHATANATQNGNTHTGYSTKYSEPVSKAYFEVTTNPSQTPRNAFPQHTNPFTQHRKALARQNTLDKSTDVSGDKFSDKSNANNKSNNNSHVPAINSASINNNKTNPSNATSQNDYALRKISPKQFVPFRTAAIGPERSSKPVVPSKNYLAPSMRSSERTSRSVDGLTLHGKMMNGTTSVDEDLNSPNKRPGSPHRPPVVRRRLIKRHRLGDISLAGSHVIQDVDQSVTLDLLASPDIPNHVPGPNVSHHIAAPLPSIGQINSPR